MSDERTATAVRAKVGWWEVGAKDPSALRRFYSDALGIGFKVDPGDYGIISGEAGTGGGMGPSPIGGLTVYLEVDDLEAALTSVEKAGGKRLVGPTPIPDFNLTIAAFTDPEGNRVGLMSGGQES
jgi:predicted enzyme related to lactoylglutathione lyase